MKINYFIFVLIIAQIIGIALARELVMVQVMFRHGARYTVHGDQLKKDPKRSEIIRNKGQLTEVGMRQLYLLGQKVRRDYIENKKLVDDKYNRAQIHIQSSNVNRTLQSCQSFMYGLYPLGSGYQVQPVLKQDYLIPPFAFNKSDEDILKQKIPDSALPNNFYPYPIHSLGDQDHILNPPCPAAKLIKKRQSAKNEKQIQEEIDKYSKELNIITQERLQLSGSYASHNLTKLWDIVMCQRYMGVEYGITEDEFQLLMYLKSYVKILQSFTKEQSGLIVTPLVEFIFDHFDNKISGSSSLRMVIESTHDSQVMPMMVVLGLISPECLKNNFEKGVESCKKFPPFASNFIFELYKINKQNYEIQIKYNGEYVKICDDSIVCDYEVFKENLKEKIVPLNQYEKKCGLVKDGLPNIDEKQHISESNSTPIVWIIIVVILSITVIGLLIYIRKLKNDSAESYQKFKNSNIVL